MKVFTVNFSEGAMKIAFATIVKAEDKGEATSKAIDHVVKHFPARKLVFHSTVEGMPKGAV